MDAANFTTSAAPSSPTVAHICLATGHLEDLMFGRCYQTAVVLAGVTTLVTSCTRDLPVQPRTSLTAQLLAAANDNFANATVITALPFSDSVDITDATMETGERAPSCAFGSSSGKTVWYTFTPAATGQLSITINAPFSTVVAVDTGAVDGLAEVICHGPFGGLSSFVAQAGTTYHFQLDGMFGGSGLLQFSLVAILPPPNDNFAAATSIPALPFDVTVDLTAASLEAGEPTTPSCANGPLTSTAWYRFTPTQTGSISASAFGFGFSTVVAAYTGTSVSSLTQVGCGAFGSMSTFRALANTTYYFQVGGVFGQTGSLEFRLAVTPPPFANFFFFPFDPSVFDVVQFGDQSFDPGGVGFEPLVWSFGDGTTGTGFNVTHRYAADGDYPVQLTVTTHDGRTAMATQTVHVRTHDVAITRFATPNAASSGQTRRIVVSINSKRYDETVEVQLFRSGPGGSSPSGCRAISDPATTSRRTSTRATTRGSNGSASSRTATSSGPCARAGRRS